MYVSDTGTLLPERDDGRSSSELPGIFSRGGREGCFILVFRAATAPTTTSAAITTALMMPRSRGPVGQYRGLFLASPLLISWFG
jgi:hypothetical protein